jgi:adenylate cyclase
MKKYALLLLLILPLIAPAAQEKPFLLSLEGSWKAKAGDSGEWSSTKIDESLWTDVALPCANYLTKYSASLFKDGEERQKTFIWFRKTITVNSRPEGMVYLQIGEVQNADEVYLNGIRIGSTGSFPPHFHSGWRNFRNYPIDPQLFALGENTIAIRVFSDAENWIVGPFRLTNDPDSNFQKMMKDLLQIHIFEYFFVLLLWISIYFLIYFIMRRKETEYLYFSLTCISMAVIVFTWFYDNQYPFIPIPSNYIYGICQSALFFLSPLLSLFVYAYLNKTVPLKRKILTVAGPAIGSLFLLFSMERSWLLSVRSVFLGLQPLFFGVIYVDLIKAVRAKKTHSIQMLVSVVPLTLFSIRDIFAFVFGIGTDGSVYFVYGMPPFFLFFAFQFIQQFVSTLNQTEKLKASFYRFVPVEFLKIIGRTNINDVKLGDSSHRALAVLFTDICQFSTISENMEPKDVFRLLNSYLSHMVPIIQQHNGFVDKYIGDAIMALFPQTPDDALQAAISLRMALRKFNAMQEENKGLIIASGTGMHFGELIMGTIGDADRMEGTVVADSVNLASRIESLTRFYGCDILMSGTMKSLVKIPANCGFRFIDRVIVAGRNATVEIYELLWDLEDSVIKPRVITLKIFERAIADYYQKELSSSKELFLQVLSMDPLDSVAEIYLKRIEQIEQSKMEWQDHSVFFQK